MKFLLLPLLLFLSACAVFTNVTPTITNAPLIEEERVAVYNEEQVRAMSSAPVPVVLTPSYASDINTVALESHIGNTVQDAFNAARRPIGVGRNQNLTDEIQIRLDQFSDPAGYHILERYWINYYPDRTVVITQVKDTETYFLYTLMHD